MKEEQHQRRFKSVLRVCLFSAGMHTFWVISALLCTDIIKVASKQAWLTNLYLLARYYVE